MKIFTSLFLAILFLGVNESRSESAPKISSLHPKMTGYQIKNNEFTFNYYLVTLESPQEVNQLVKNYQDLVTTQGAQAEEITTAVKWVNAPKSDRFPNETPAPEFDSEHVAHQVTTGIPHATLDRVDIIGEANQNLWNRFKNWVSPKKQSIQIAITSITFNGLRIGVNTYKQYNAFVASHLPTALVAEHSAWVFLWVTVSAIYARQVNNYVNHNTFTSDDEKAKLYSFTPKNNEEKSLIRLLQNLHGSTTQQGKYFRFFITESLFVGAITSGQALINVLNHVSAFESNASGWVIGLKIFGAMVLSTATQGTSEVANDKFREWARLSGMAKNTMELFTQGGFALASILSVTGALFMASGDLMSGLGYLGALFVISKGSDIIFSERIKAMNCNELLGESH